MPVLFVELLLDIFFLGKRAMWIDSQAPKTSRSQSASCGASLSPSESPSLPSLDSGSIGVQSSKSSLSSVSRSRIVFGYGHTSIPPSTSLRINSNTFAPSPDNASALAATIMIRLQVSRSAFRKRTVENIPLGSQRLNDVISG